MANPITEGRQENDPRGDVERDLPRAAPGVPSTPSPQAPPLPPAPTPGNNPLEIEAAPGQFVDLQSGGLEGVGQVLQQQDTERKLGQLEDNLGRVNFGEVGPITDVSNGYGPPSSPEGLTSWVDVEGQIESIMGQAQQFRQSVQPAQMYGPADPNTIKAFEQYAKLRTPSRDARGNYHQFAPGTEGDQQAIDTQRGLNVWQRMGEDLLGIGRLGGRLFQTVVAAPVVSFARNLEKRSKEVGGLRAAAESVTLAQLGMATGGLTGIAQTPDLLSAGVETWNYIGSSDWQDNVAKIAGIPGLAEASRALAKEQDGLNGFGAKQLDVSAEYIRRLFAGGTDASERAALAKLGRPGDNDPDYVPPPNGYNFNLNEAFNPLTSPERLNQIWGAGGEGLQAGNMGEGLLGTGMYAWDLLGTLAKTPAWWAYGKAREAGLLVPLGEAAPGVPLRGADNPFQLAGQVLQGREVAGLGRDRVYSVYPVPVAYEPQWETNAKGEPIALKKDENGNIVYKPQPLYTSNVAEQFWKLPIALLVDAIDFDGPIGWAKAGARNLKSIRVSRNLGKAAARAGIRKADPVVIRNAFKSVGRTGQVTVESLENGRSILRRVDAREALGSSEYQKLLAKQQVPIYIKQTDGKVDDVLSLPRQEVFTDKANPFFDPTFRGAKTLKLPVPFVDAQVRPPEALRRLGRDVDPRQRSAMLGELFPEVKPELDVFTLPNRPVVDYKAELKELLKPTRQRADTRFVMQLDGQELAADLDPLLRGARLEELDPSFGASSLAKKTELKVEPSAPLSNRAMRQAGSTERLAELRARASTPEVLDESVQGLPQPGILSDEARRLGIDVEYPPAAVPGTQITEQVDSLPVAPREQPRGFTPSVQPPKPKRNSPQAALQQVERKDLSNPILGETVSKASPRQQRRQQHAAQNQATAQRRAAASPPAPETKGQRKARVKRERQQYYDAVKSGKATAYPPSQEEYILASLATVRDQSVEDVLRRDVQLRVADSIVDEFRRTGTLSEASQMALREPGFTESVVKRLADDGSVDIASDGLITKQAKFYEGVTGEDIATLENIQRDLIIQPPLNLEMLDAVAPVLRPAQFEDVLTPTQQVIALESPDLALETIESVIRTNEDITALAKLHGLIPTNSPTLSNSQISRLRMTRRNTQVFNRIGPPQADANIQRFLEEGIGQMVYKPGGIEPEQVVLLKRSPGFMGEEPVYNSLKQAESDLLAASQDTEVASPELVEDLREVQGRIQAIEETRSVAAKAEGEAYRANLPDIPATPEEEAMAMQLQQADETVEGVGNTLKELGLERQNLQAKLIEFQRKNQETVVRGGVPRLKYPRIEPRDMSDDSQAAGTLAEKVYAMGADGFAQRSRLYADGPERVRLGEQLADIEQRILEAQAKLDTATDAKATNLRQVRDEVEALPVEGLAPDTATRIREAERSLEELAGQAQQARAMADQLGDRLPEAAQQAIKQLDDEFSRVTAELQTLRGATPVNQEQLSEALDPIIDTDLLVDIQSLQRQRDELLAQLPEPDRELLYFGSPVRGGFSQFPGRYMPTRNRLGLGTYLAKSESDARIDALAAFAPNTPPVMLEAGPNIAAVRASAGNLIDGAQRQAQGEIRDIFRGVVDEVFGQVQGQPSGLGRTWQAKTRNQPIEKWFDSISSAWGNKFDDTPFPEELGRQAEVLLTRRLQDAGYDGIDTPSYRVIFDESLVRPTGQVADLEPVSELDAMLNLQKQYYRAGDQSNAAVARNRQNLNRINELKLQQLDEQMESGQNAWLAAENQRAATAQEYDELVALDREVELTQYRQRQAQVEAAQTKQANRLDEDPQQRYCP